MNFFLSLIVCSVQNHAPNCFCDSGYTGDPAVSCNPIEIGKFCKKSFTKSFWLRKKIQIIPNFMQQCDHNINITLVRKSSAFVL